MPEPDAELGQALSRAASRRFYIALAFILLIVIALAAVALAYTRHRAATDAERASETLVQVLAEQTRRTIQAADLVLLMLRDLVVTDDDLPVHDRVLRDTMQARVAEMPYVRALFVIGPDGMIIHDTDYPQTPNVSLADRDYFRFHASDPDPGLHVGDPLISRSVGVWFVSLSRRITLPDGTFGGIVVAAIEPGYLERFYREIDLGEGGSITIMTEGGIILARHPDGAALIGTHLPEADPVLARARAGQDRGVFWSDGTPAGQRLVAYSTLRDDDRLVVMSEVSAAQALGSWQIQAAAIIAVALTLCALVVTLATLVKRRWDGLARSLHEQRERQQERLAAQALLLRQARSDPVTGVANRVGLREILERLLAGPAAGWEGPVLFNIEIDGIRAIYDTLGPTIGDRLLSSVADRLRTAVGDDGTVAYLGSGEFAVLALRLSDEETIATAERLLGSVSGEFEVEGAAMPIDAAVGIARVTDDLRDADRILQAASVATYRAKEDRAHRWAVFSPVMLERLEERQRLRADLREALAHGQFALFYQPIVDAGSGAVTGFEALLRWRHPIRGVLAPGEFIGVAEEGGLMVPIGAWVLAEACREAAQWPDHLKVSVNVSPTQLRVPGLGDTVRQALADAGLPAARLCLEITESSILQDNAANQVLMSRLRRLGVGLALDDFGTGYASLHYLQRFPFNTLKVDRGFISRLIEDEDSRAIVRAILDLAAMLKLRTVAEGVETREQLEWLRAARCNEVQGYLVSVPMPAADVAAFLHENAVFDVGGGRRAALGSA